MTRAEPSETGYLCARGADARDFLQGQLTQDMRALAADRALLAAATTAQGRVFAVVRVRALPGDAILLVLPRSEVAALRERLARYVLRARVELRDESDEASDKGIASGAHLDALPPLLEDIRGGVPRIAPETRELFVPQTLNLDLLGALSFTKGCFTGQEIVARTQHLGRIKRRMVRARVATPAAPPPGTTIYANGEVTGHVVTASRAGDALCELLATMSIADASHPLELAAPGGVRLERLPLPYRIAELDGDAPAV